MLPSMRLLYSLIFTLLLVNSVTFAQTFTVTSNADSGPGTLREALTTANDPNRTGVFTINFQMPGNGNDYTNRTIRLRTVLPYVPSNTIIDGSSSSWSPLGVSGAKIILEPEYITTRFSALLIGQTSATNTQTTGVEIYGLCIRNFAAITNLQNVDMAQGSGIVIDYRANNIKIGAPGKGNVIIGNINGISIQNAYNFNTVPLSNIRIQSNLIGVLYDGITPHTNVIGVSASLYDCALEVGGDNAGEGNVIAANRINLDIKRYNSSVSRFDINIINNKIGVDYTGTKDFHDLPLFLSSSSLELSGLKIDAVNSAVYVRNNVIGGNRTVGVSIANADFILTGNHIGTDATGSVNLGNGMGVKIEAGASGTIGGATNAEKNQIAHNNFGVETVSAKPVKVTRNSMFCNKNFGIGKTLTITQPFVQVLKYNANHVSGKATPNSEIELFYTQNCNDLCEGKTYFATVQAGTDGRWEYNGSLTQRVTATASLLNAATSPFSNAQLLPNEAAVLPVTCNANGSITIPEVREGFTFSWVRIESNGTRVPLGNTQNVSNLEVGTYEVTIDDGCKSFPNVFLIRDQKLTKPTITPPTPACGQTSFSFRAEVLRGNGTIRYEWKNATGAVVSIANPATLPEGTYTVTASDASGCSITSDPITISRRPAPIINTTSMIRTPASCGVPNGAIRGITIGDATGTVTYSWYKHDPTSGIMINTIVASTADLIDVEGGTYTLRVTDQGTCSPVSQTFTIAVNNIIVISAGAITPGRCGLNNGVIDNVTITNADQYTWIKMSNNDVLLSGAYAPGTSIKITDLEPGSYMLRASNSTSVCTYSRTFVVPREAPATYTFTQTVVNTTCELDNGNISLNFTSTVIPVRFQWKDELNNNYVGTLRELKNLPVGVYRLYAYDINNCETIIGPFTINATPKLVIEPSSGIATTDACGLKRGSVTGVNITGGLGAYTYKWMNELGEVVQTTKDLTNVASGTYYLEVKDMSACGLAISQNYTVGNIYYTPETPVLKDIRVCYVSDITIPVIGAQEGTYQLFANIEDEFPIYESNNGIFNFKVSKTATYYIRRKLGVCLSDFAAVKVEVTHDNLEIGNIMTPNGDGLNDTWMLKGLPEYKGNNIKIYSKSGQLIYEAIGDYKKPFDGTFRGKELPAGVYYYIIDLRAECKPIGGSITLIR